MNTDELKRLAEAAPSGPYAITINGMRGKFTIDCPEERAQEIIAADTDEMDGASVSHAFRDYLVAASPSAILELIAQLEAAQKDAGRYRRLRDIAPWTSGLAVILESDVEDDVAMLTKEQLDAAVDSIIG